MPSPIGHALAGVAAGWAIAPARGSRLEALARGTVFAFAATAADFDLLASVHRGPTHSLAAAVIAGALAWVWCAVVHPLKGDTHVSHPFRLALAVTAACATHTLLDWLGSDSSPPIGIMALWPVSHTYYESQYHLFLAISRRYWLPDFWMLNLRAVGREVAILGPVAFLVVWMRRGRGIG
jgi:membrane-bound metal-dependent hydrolase YbcI (DUF457 family)